MCIIKQSVFHGLCKVANVEVIDPNEKVACKNCQHIVFMSDFPSLSLCNAATTYSFDSIEGVNV